MIWRFIRHRINNLDKRFQEAQQELIRSLYGREDTPPRWKFCVSYANGNLGQSVGSLFVKKYFDEQSKADVSLNTCHISANSFRGNYVFFFGSWSAETIQGMKLFKGGNY